MKKFFSVMVNTVYAAFLLLALAVLLSMFSVAGVRLYTVLSGSMEPTLHTGSIIFVIPQASYQVGDVVTRKTEDPAVTVTHRISEKIDRDGDTVFHTKGDANDVADAEDIPVSSIIGKEAVTVPWMGYAVNFAKTKEGFALVVIVPAAIIVYEELKKIRMEVAALWKKKREVKVKENIAHTEEPQVRVQEPVAVNEAKSVEKRKIV
ncbi:MAG: signal peptidase I [Candidatus Moranbacteria bacterium]|nr:signal peptidase I [Candidatus Moranbacteria bacterium]